MFKSDFITEKEFSRFEPINVFHSNKRGRQPISQLKSSDSASRGIHTVFKKCFNYNGGKMSIKISADDYCKLYINGVFVLQGPAPAYFNHYNYNSVDITSFLKKGTNIVAAAVYYDGCINRVWNSGDNRFGLIADFYLNGEYSFGTDESWQYKRQSEYLSKTLVGYDTAFLDDMDMRLKDRKIFEGGFDDSWQHAVKKQHDYIFSNEPADVVDVYEVKPVVSEYKNGYWFLDFGKEYAAALNFTAKGNCGDEITVISAEELASSEFELTDGSGNNIRIPLSDTMRCGCKYKETVILSGNNDEITPYLYRGMRYAVVVAKENAVKKESFRLVAQNHSFKTAGSFESSNKVLNDIFELCRHTLNVGVQEGFLDCIQREKGQYLGDFTVSGLSYLYLTGDEKFYKKTLLDFAHTAEINKGLMSVAPGSVMQEIADFSLQYPLQVLNYYRYTKDKETVRSLLPIIDGVLEYFSEYENADGMLESVAEKWNLVDWPKNLRDDYDCELADPIGKNIVHNVINAFWVGANRCSEILKSELSVPFVPRWQELSKSFCNTFYCSETKLFKDRVGSSHSALHSNVLPAFFGITPHEARDTAARFIAEKGFSCGVQFSYFVLKALNILGAYSAEYSLLLSDGEHSFINMLKEGATTTFEAWGKEQKWNTSLCHPWATSPVIIIAEDLSSIAPSELCFKLHFPNKEKISPLKF